MKKLVALLLVAMLLFTVGCSSGNEPSEEGTPEQSGTTEPIELICAHGYPATSDEQKYMVWIADEIEKRTDGGLTMEVYSDGSMGSEMEVCGQIIAGAIDVGLSEGSAWADAVNVPALGVFGLPYLYSNLDGLKNAGLTVVPGAFQKLLEDNDVNLQGFVPFSGGLRCVWTVDEPIRTASDFAGKKMRVPEIKLFADTMKGLGANPTPVAWTELFTALGQGVVDGLEIDADTGVKNNLHEVTKYFTRTYHMGSLNIIAMNKDKWNSLPAEYQEIFTQVAYEAAEQQFDVRAAAIAESEKALSDAGLEIIDLSAEDMATLTANMKPIWDEYSDNYGVADIIAELSEAGQQTYK